MIKARELTFGCWVRNKVSKEAIRVEGVTKKKIAYHRRGVNTQLSYARLCEIEPVPITREFLELNCFVFLGIEDDHVKYKAMWVDEDGSELYCGVNLYRDGKAAVSIYSHRQWATYVVDSVHRLQVLIGFTDMFNYGENIRVE